MPKKEFIMVAIERESSNVIVDCYAYTHVEQFGQDADGHRGWPILRVDDVIIDQAYDDVTFDKVELTADERNIVMEKAANKALGR